jgi:hypothetical protein
MLTVEYLINGKFPLDHVLTDADKKALLEENKNNNYSYLALMREMFAYKHTNVGDLLTGWGGIRLVEIKPKDYKKKM